MSPKPSRGEQDAELRALFQAAVERDRAAVEQLIARSPDLVRRSATVGATRAESESYFFAAINTYLNAGDTALHLAAAAYAVDVVTDLLARGADVRAKNRMGAEPLHYAAVGVPDSPSWNPEAQATVIRRLLEAGADPNAPDKNGVGPLHRAVRTRCAAAVEALLAGGADAQRKNKRGSTPLQLARQTTGRGGTGSPAARAEQQAIVELLLLK